MFLKICKIRDSWDKWCSCPLTHCFSLSLCLSISHRLIYPCHQRVQRWWGWWREGRVDGGWGGQRMRRRWPLTISLFLLLLHPLSYSLTQCLSPLISFFFSQAHPPMPSVDATVGEGVALRLDDKEGVGSSRWLAIPRPPLVGDSNFFFKFLKLNFKKLNIYIF